MTRREYNESVGIRMLDVGDQSIEVDDDWKEFVSLIINSIKNISDDEEEEDI